MMDEEDFEEFQKTHGEGSRGKKQRFQPESLQDDVSFLGKRWPGEEEDLPLAPRDIVKASQLKRMTNHLVTYDPERTVDASPVRLDRRDAQTQSNIRSRPVESRSPSRKSNLDMSGHESTRVRRNEVSQSTSKSQKKRYNKLKRVEREQARVPEKLAERTALCKESTNRGELISRDAMRKNGSRANSPSH